MKFLSQNQVRSCFPILKQRTNGKPLIYFDNAATTQKPLVVIERYQQFYEEKNANVHRASHALSGRATSAFEYTREQVKNFIGAKDTKEIIWTKGTTESINLVSQSWGMSNLKAGDEVVLSYSEHHANIVPWQIVAKATGAVIKILPLNEFGIIDLNKLNQVINKNTKIVCCAHISNVVGKINPIKEIIKFAKRFDALTLIDGAQAIAHECINVTELNCDFYVFSAHKAYGPTGVGVLYGKFDVLASMPPYQGGGEMIKHVSFAKTTFGDLPFKFEAGTPNIAGVIAFSAALDFMTEINNSNVSEYEKLLTDYCFEKLSQVPALTFIVNGKPDIPIFSFVIEGHHNHDIAVALDNHGIAVRSGHHCAMPLMQYLNIDGCLRLSLSTYNSIEEVDYVISTLLNITSESQFDSPLNTIETVNNDIEITDNSNLISLISIFEKAKSWDSKHREIMLQSKRLPRLAASERKTEYLISGCESQAWLKALNTCENSFEFIGDSDAKVIRGLMQIVLTAYNGKSAQQIHDFDITDYFKRLGLLQHLSPSRGNGLWAIVNKIKLLAPNTPF